MQPEKNPAGGEPVPPRRMIRQGPWKLNYYHGEPPELYNLDDDPGEMQDLGTDAEFEEVRKRLLARLLERWDPDEIDRRHRQRLRDHELLTRWGAVTQPDDPDTWQAPPGCNTLARRSEKRGK